MKVTLFPTVNLFRLAGDVAHLVAFYFLWQKVKSAKTVAGLSLKTMIIYCVVFTTRYLDLLWLPYLSTISIYNVIMKCLYLAATYYMVYVMVFSPIRDTYEAGDDAFPLVYILAPAAALGIIAPYKYTFSEILWAFSIWLEAGAILPQLLMIQKKKEAETITANYVFCLGIYRLMYLFNWIYRYFSGGHTDVISWLAGVVQTVLFVDFFYIYFKHVPMGEKLILPK